MQKGLHSLDEVIFANYGETKPRHFHMLYNEWMAMGRARQSEIAESSAG